MKLTGSPWVFLSCISWEKSALSLSPMDDPLHVCVLPELLRSAMLEAQSSVSAITTILPLPRFSSLGFKALLQTLKSCSSERWRLQLN